MVCADKFQELVRSQGISEFEDQFNLDATEPEFIIEAGGYRKLSCEMPNLSHIAMVISILIMMDYCICLVCCI